MTYRRTLYPHFDLANNAYVGALVTFYEVDEAGFKTNTKATLYAQITGGEQLQNPMTLGSQGQSLSPIYIEKPVVAQIGTQLLGQVETGIFYPQAGQWRDVWAGNQFYLAGDIVKSDTNQNIYVVTEDHISASITSDVLAGKLLLVFDVATVQTNASIAATAASTASTASTTAATAASGASASATSATASAISAAASAAEAAGAVASTQFNNYVTGGTASAYTVTDVDLFVGTGTKFIATMHVSNNANPTLRRADQTGTDKEIVRIENGVSVKSLGANELVIGRTYMFIKDGALDKWVVQSLVDRNTLKNNETAILSKGFTTQSYSIGTITSGTVTPNAANGQIQHYTNNGAHTLAALSDVSVVSIEVTNGASAGAITTSGFTRVTGDTFTTTNGHKFICDMRRINGSIQLHVTAMQ